MKRPLLQEHSSPAWSLHRLAVFVALLCCIVAMFYARDVLLHNSTAFLEMYPFLFLIALGRVNRREDLGRGFYLKAGFWLVPGTAFALSGILLSRLSLVWMGSYWNALAVAHLAGVTFAWPATLLVFAVPPLTGFTSLVLGFKLRILVTEICGWVLTALDPGTVTSGNQIWFLQQWYSVDRVCEGMKMGSASFLLVLILIRRVLPGAALAIGVLALPLWFMVNLLRVCLLIIFRVPASTWQHELIGLVMFVCGILFPLAMIALLFPRTREHALPEKATAQESSAESRVYSAKTLRRLQLALPGVPVLILLLLFGFKPAEPETNYQWPVRVLEFQLDPASLYPDSRIAVYHSDGAQLIIKHQLFAIGTGHDPRICFEGAGFVFHEDFKGTGSLATSRATQANAERRTFYNRGIVEKAHQRATLLWWYSVDGKQTSSDLEWRLSRLRGHDVVQWNLYGRDEARLVRVAERLAHCNCLPSLQ
ncbi:MAG: exosortase N [Leptospirales bacterium]|nr:exosortase N [Leptospirales bacterium]